MAGAQFAAALITRFWAGSFADRRGAKQAVVIGLCLAAASGLLYLLSLRFLPSPTTLVTVLIVGRAVLGAAESAMITGALARSGRTTGDGSGRKDIGERRRRTWRS